MSRRIYLASSWRNPWQPALVKQLRAAGHEVYDFRNPPNNSGFGWEEIHAGWQGWTPAEYLAALKHPRAIEGFAADWGAMQWADTGVLAMPCGRSAHLEAGYFVGSGKELFVLLHGLSDTPKALRIPLTRGYEATVDERDGGLAEHKWHAHPSTNTVYAARSVGPHGRQRTVMLHRVIVEAPDGVEVDHIDGDGLNNRRSNLRISTRAENGQNNHVALGQVPFRGVFVDTSLPGRFRAAIRHDGKRTYLGTFGTPEDAARAFDAAAIRLHGAFARTNFPLPEPRITPELMYKMATEICLDSSELLAALARERVPA